MIGGPRYCSWAPEFLLRDHSVRRMGAEAFGGYCSLLIEAWLDPDGSLPDDDVELALLSRLGSKGWAKFGPSLRLLFFIDSSRLRSEIVDEARDRAQKRSTQGKLAVEARIEKSRYVESGKPSGDHRGIIGRSSKDSPLDQPYEKEKEKEKEKVKVKEETPSPSSSVGSDKPTGKVSEEFESFWKAWRALGPKTTLNKQRTLEAWRKTLRRGATPDDLLQAIKVYDRYITHREKSGKTDQRDFIPMPETWLNQDRWASEYPEELFDSMIGEPISGRDFYWKTFKDEKGHDVMGKFVIDPETGEKTDDRFKLSIWKERQKEKLK